MIDQKSVCEALGEKLGKTPQWIGNTCKIETEDAELEVVENGGVRMRVKNPIGAQKIAEMIKQVYTELREH